MLRLLSLKQPARVSWDERKTTAALLTLRNSGGATPPLRYPASIEQADSSATGDLPLTPAPPYLRPPTLSPRAPA